MGGEVFADLRVRRIGVPILEETEEGAADQREIGEQPWFGASGVVLQSKEAEKQLQVQPNRSLLPTNSFPSDSKGPCRVERAR